MTTFTIEILRKDTFGNADETLEIYDVSAHHIEDALCEGPLPCDIAYDYGNGDYLVRYSAYGMRDWDVSIQVRNDIGEEIFTL